MQDPSTYLLANSEIVQAPLRAVSLQSLHSMLPGCEAGECCLGGPLAAFISHLLLNKHLPCVIVRKLQCGPCRHN